MVPRERVRVEKNLISSAFARATSRLFHRETPHADPCAQRKEGPPVGVDREADRRRSSKELGGMTGPVGSVDMTAVHMPSNRREVCVGIAAFRRKVGASRNKVGRYDIWERGGSR